MYQYLLMRTLQISIFISVNSLDPAYISVVLYKTSSSQTVSMSQTMDLYPPELSHKEYQGLINYPEIVGKSLQ